MIRDHFRVLVVDLATGKGKVVKVPGRDEVAGGSGLGALLFTKYGKADRPWDDPEQPVIFAIGPLTGYFPLMSKTVAAFKSPYHDQYAESHAGGRSALALRFADLDALVLTGRALSPSVLVVGGGVVVQPPPLVRPGAQPFGPGGGLPASGIERGPLPLGLGRPGERQAPQAHVPGLGTPIHPAHRPGRRK